MTVEIKQTVVLDEKMLDAIAKNYIAEPGIRRKTILLIVLSVFILALGIVFLVDGDYAFGAANAVIGTVFLVFAAVAYKRILLKNLKKVNASRLNKESTYLLNDETILIESDIGHGEYNWSVCENVKDMGDYIGVFFSTQIVVLLEKARLSEQELEWLRSKAPQKNG